MTTATVDPFPRGRRGGASAVALGAAVLALQGCPGAPAGWQQVHQGLPGALISVWGTSATDVYTVGGDARDGSGPMALRYNGTSWRRLRTGLAAGDLWWVYGVAPDTVFMVGTGGVVLRFNPATAAVARMPTPGDDTLYGIWGATPADVWAVGGATSGMASTLWHFDGSAWVDASPTLPAGFARTGSLFKVWGTAANDVWVVGSGGAGLHWNGTAWSTVATATTRRLLTVHGNGRTRVAVGGSGSAVVLEGDGAGWLNQNVQELPALNGVFVPTTGDPVAVGIAGLVARRGAAGWRADPDGPPTPLDFHAVWVDPGGGIWAVGGQIVTAPLNAGMMWHLGGAPPSGTIVGP